MRTNVLYFGDNLPLLRKREYFSDESIDLVYLDPPFNSKKDYNVLFKENGGVESEAQIKAFTDTWHWGDNAQATYHDIQTNAPLKVGKLIYALYESLGQNDVMAYLVMMTARLIELHRVLKPTGSLYLHCDPAASHYLKIVLDQIFGAGNFRNEIVWRYRRWPAKARKFQKMHDVILFYTKSGENVFNTLYGYEQLAESTLKTFGTKKQIADFSSGHRKPGRLDEETPGPPLSDVWEVGIIAPISKERQGYPTQKPQALLERIIQASSNDGDIVLDPFCGCGTAVVAAQKLKRKWIGIDITHLAINLMRNRLKDSFGIKAEVIGEPVDLAGARALANHDRYQFQFWALGLIGARPAGEKKKGADAGIDGVITFIDDTTNKPKRVIVQVKSGHVGVATVRELETVAANEAMGVLITLEQPTEPMKSEALSAGYYHSPVWDRDYNKIQILTVEEILDGKAVDMPPQAQTSVTFAKAPRVAVKEGEQLKMGRELKGEIRDD